MQRLTSVTITSIAAASGSRTKPMRSVCSPNVNQVKFWKVRYAGVCSVCRNNAIEKPKAAICPTIASEAAALRLVPEINKIDNAAVSGSAGINQTLLAIQGIIIL